MTQAIATREYNEMNVQKTSEDSNGDRKGSKASLPLYPLYPVYPLPPPPTPIPPLPPPVATSAAFVVVSVREILKLPEDMTMSIVPRCRLPYRADLLRTRHRITW